MSCSGAPRFAALVLGLIAARMPSQETVAPAGFWPTRIEVKLREGSGAVLAGGQLRSRAGVDLSRVARLFAEATGVERCITVPLELLDRWHREADERLPEAAVRPGHLGLWFRLRAADAAAAAALLRELRGDPLVEEAGLEPIPFTASPAVCGMPGDIPPPTPSFEHLQTYRGPAPDGLGGEYARRILGGRGHAARVLHMEVDWLLDHEDLDVIGLQSFLSPPTPGTGELADHGAGVVGILAASRNGYGVTGLVDATEVRLIGWEKTGGVANAIALAAQNRRPGDIGVLIAAYQLSQVKPRDFVPVEYFQVNFDAILTAATQGLIIVSAATNGDNDLDDPRFLRRFDLGFRDSGALMIGATAGPTPERADFSNYGSRVDANGWGDAVATVGFGTLFFPNRDRRQAYTERYAGTSSATALVSATVAALVSAVRFQDERELDSWQIRGLLRGTGTKVNGNIGNRPDLEALLAVFGLPDSLELDRQEVKPAQQFTLTMSGPAGSSFALVGGTEIGPFDIGLNRRIHIAPATLVPLGAFVLSVGTRRLTLAVPNDPGLLDLDLLFQGLRVGPGSEMHVSSSCELAIR